jgi:putative tryptophan/tyrosine transport system substrate-binding protein
VNPCTFQKEGLARKTYLPSMFQNHEFVEAGGLLSYAPSTVGNNRRAVFFVDKLEQPTTFELVISLETAKAFGLTSDPSVCAAAGR